MFIMIYKGMSHEQKCSFINHYIIFLIAAELSTLMIVLGTGKFNLRNHFNIIKLITQGML